MAPWVGIQGASPRQLGVEGSQGFSMIAMLVEMLVKFAAICLNIYGISRIPRVSTISGELHMRIHCSAAVIVALLFWNFLFLAIVQISAFAFFYLYSLIGKFLAARRERLALEAATRRTIELEDRRVPFSRYTHFGPRGRAIRSLNWRVNPIAPAAILLLLCTPVSAEKSVTVQWSEYMLIALVAAIGFLYIRMEITETKRDFRMRVENVSQNLTNQVNEAVAKATGKLEQSMEKLLKMANETKESTEKKASDLANQASDTMSTIDTVVKIGAVGAAGYVVYKTFTDDNYVDRDSKEVTDAQRNYRRESNPATKVAALASLGIAVYGASQPAMANYASSFNQVHRMGQTFFNATRQARKVRAICAICQGPVGVTADQTGIYYVCYGDKEKCRNFEKATVPAFLRLEGEDELKQTVQCASCGKKPTEYVVESKYDSQGVQDSQRFVWPCTCAERIQCAGTTIREDKQSNTLAEIHSWNLPAWNGDLVGYNCQGYKSLKLPHIIFIWADELTGMPLYMNHGQSESQPRNIVLVTRLTMIHSCDKCKCYGCHYAILGRIAHIPILAVDTVLFANPNKYFWFEAWNGLKVALGVAVTGYAGKKLLEAVGDLFSRWWKPKAEERQMMSLASKPSLTINPPQRVGDTYGGLVFHYDADPTDSPKSPSATTTTTTTTSDAKEFKPSEQAMKALKESQEYGNPMLSNVPLAVLSPEEKAAIAVSVAPAVVDPKPAKALKRSYDEILKHRRAKKKEQNERRKQQKAEEKAKEAKQAEQVAAKKERQSQKANSKSTNLTEFKAEMFTLSLIHI